MEVNLAEVVIFTGGTGAAELIRGMLSHSQVSLSIIINGYDNGKSTGNIRGFVDGMLGPSDFRKTVSTCLNATPSSADTAVGSLLEERINSRECIELLTDFNSDICLLKFKNVPYSVTKFVIDSLKCFLFFEGKKSGFSYKDCAVGNLIFAGVYLGIAKQQFNDAVTKFAEGLNCPAKILNVTTGENFFLAANALGDKYLLDEGILVDNPDMLKIQNVFFSRKPLDNDTDAAFALKNDLRPSISVLAVDCIKTADLILYAPGTQFSSLIPSYLTAGLLEAITASKAVKYLLVNLAKDKDMVGYTSTEMINKILSYLAPTNCLDGTVDKIMIDPLVDDVDSNALLADAANILHYETHSLDGTRHDRDVAVASVMNLYFTTIGETNKHLGFCSILVPTLNEDWRLWEALSSISDFFDLLTNTRRIEVIVIDGARDPLVQRRVDMLGNSFRYIPGFKRRGDSLKAGIEAANGGMICIFPGDFEFKIQDLLEMIRYSEAGSYDIVLGSRSQNLSRLNEINIGRGFVSRFGGIVVTLFLFVLHDFHVRDILTTLRVYKTSSLAKLKFACRGVDLDVEIPLNAFKAGMKICELPVSYNARGYSDGKKITARDGLNVLLHVVISKFRNMSN